MSGEWAGAERATGTALATGMQVMKYRQDAEANAAATALKREELQGMNAHRAALEANAAAQLRMQDESHQQNLRMAKIKADQAAKDATPLDVQDTLTKMGMTPSQQELWLSNPAVASQVDQVDGRYYTTSGKGKAVLATLAKDPNFILQHHTAGIADIDKQLSSLPADDGKMKPEEIAQVQATKEQLLAQRTKFAAAKLQTEQQVRMANKESTGMFYDQGSDTWKIANNQTGEVYADLGKMVPEKVKEAQMKGEKLVWQRAGDKLVGLDNTGEVVAQVPIGVAPGTRSHARGGGGFGRGGREKFENYNLTDGTQRALVVRNGKFYDATGQDLTNWVYSKAGVAKPAKGNGQHVLSGQRPGVYKVGDKTVRWDGNKEI